MSIKFDSSSNINSTLKEITNQMQGLQNSGVDTIARVYKMPEEYGAKGDGVTNDAVAIQSALNFIRDNGGGVLVLKNGKKYGIASTLTIYNNTTILGYGATIVQIVTGIHMLVNAGHNDSTGSTRNSNIKILGVTFDANYMGSSDITRLRTLFDHVTNLVIKDCTFLSTGNVGKYMVALGDTKDVLISDCYFNCDSDGIHLVGKNYHTVIENITGYTGDDVIGVTTHDYDTYAYETGDIVGLTIRNVYAESSQRIVLLARAADTALSDVIIENVKQIGGAGIEIADSTNTNTSIKLDNISIKGFIGSKIQIYGANIGTLFIDANVDIVSQSTNATIYKIIVKGAKSISFMQGYPTTIGYMSIENISSKIELTGATITDCFISKCQITNITQQIKLGNITNCFIDNIHLNSTVIDTVGIIVLYGIITNLIIRNSVLNACSYDSWIFTTYTNCYIVNLTYENCIIQGTRVYDTNVASDYVGTHNFTLKNCTINCKRVIDAGSGYYNLNVFIYNTVITSTLDMFYFGQTVTVKFYGDNLNQVITAYTSTANFYMYGDIPCDISKFKKAVMGRAYNTNSGLSCGVGYCICDGTNWKNLFSGATY